MFKLWKREYQIYARRFILYLQKPALPSCESLLMRQIKHSLSNTPSKSRPQNIARSAETLVYRISLDLVDSPNYRLSTGILTPIGEQLLHICSSCLGYFLEKGYISPEEHDEHNDYLKHCNQDFEAYSLL